MMVPVVPGTPFFGLDLGGRTRLLGVHFFWGVVFLRVSPAQIQQCRAVMLDMNHANGAHRALVIMARLLFAG